MISPLTLSLSYKVFSQGLAQSPLSQRGTCLAEANIKSKGAVDLLCVVVVWGGGFVVQSVYSPLVDSLAVVQSEGDSTVKANT